MTSIFVGRPCLTAFVTASRAMWTIVAEGLSVGLGDRGDVLRDDRDRDVAGGPLDAGGDGGGDRLRPAGR